MVLISWCFCHFCVVFSGGAGGDAAAPHRFDGCKKRIRPGNSRMRLKLLFHLKSAGIKLIIFTAFINKGLMVALFDNFTFFKHDDIF